MLNLPEIQYLSFMMSKLLYRLVLFRQQGNKIFNKICKQGCMID